MTGGTAILFTEKQHFSRWWLMLGLEPIIIGIGLTVAGIITPLVQLYVTAGAFALPSLLVLSTLETVITSDEIRIRFRPFKWKWKHIPFSEILHAHVRAYDPLGDFGGWGIRYAGKKEGWCYNARGKMGLQLEFSDGKRLLIGTQDAERLSEIVVSIVNPLLS